MKRTKQTAKENQLKVNLPDSIKKYLFPSKEQILKAENKRLRIDLAKAEMNEKLNEYNNKTQKTLDKVIEFYDAHINTYFLNYLNELVNIKIERAIYKYTAEQQINQINNE